MTDELLVETLVSTLLLCSMSMIVAPDGPEVEPEVVVALAPVKVTVPKLAKGTRPPGVYDQQLRKRKARGLHYRWTRSPRRSTQRRTRRARAGQRRCA